MSAQPTHNLEQYKKQAKDLLKAYQAGDAEAIALVRQHLPRLGEDVTPEPIVLTEAQHVVATQHGFKDWNWLRTVSTLDFERLVGCSHRDLVVLLRESDGRDIVVCLSRATETLRNRFLDSVSDRLHGFLEEEIGFLGPVSDEQVAEAQYRLLGNAAQLAARGQFTWPDGNRPPAPSAEKPKPQPPPFARLAARRLDEMSFDEIVELWRDMADLARREGILALDVIDASPFVRESLDLIVDGTEPDLVVDILETRLQHAILGGLEIRGKMVIEALMSILSGDNPRIVHHKLGTFFVDHRAPVSAQRPAQQTPEEIEARLENRLHTPLAEMDYPEIAALFTDMGYLNRQIGLGSLDRFIEKANDPLLRLGLERMAAGDTPDHVMVALETRFNKDLLETEARYRASIEGVAAIQQGKTPEEVERAMREQQASA